MVTRREAYGGRGENKWKGLRVHLSGLTLNNIGNNFFF